MGKPNQFKAEQFIKAIPGTGGIISTIAARVGCQWHTARKYIEEYPTIKQAYQNEKSAIDDKALSNVLKAVADGDLSVSMWWVKMKLGSEFHETQHVVYEVDWDADEDKA
jgi:hypothetical protein